MRICVTGGCGYKGTVLVPKLLKAGHTVQVWDILWFSSYLRPHPRLSIKPIDIRNTGLSLEGFDAVIHLAAVANDPTGDLNPKLTWEVNALATTQLAYLAVRDKVRHFIYASSGSVYGVCEDGEVTEESPLVPLSEYNKTKMVAERAVLSYADKMVVQVLRPATVCGYSPRFRADVLVNMLTMEATRNGKLHLLNPCLYRPNIHIEDVTDLYVFMLGRPDLTGIFNAGFENYTVREVAQLVAQQTGASVTEAQGSADKRSYRINSGKILGTGFAPKKTVIDAIREIVDRQIVDEDKMHNLRWMKRRAA